MFGLTGVGDGIYDCGGSFFAWYFEYDYAKVDRCGVREESVRSCCIFKDVKGDGDNVWLCLVLYFICKISKEGL